MKSRLIILVVAAVGFAAGMLAVRQVSGGPAGGVEFSQPKPGQGGKRENDTATSKGTASPKGSKHDFASLVRNSRHIFSKFFPINRELERMDVGELKSLALELAVSLKAEGPLAEKQAAYSVQQSIAAELYRRDGAAALDWAAGIASEEEGKGILSAILSEVTKDNPEKGKEWIERYRGEYGDEWARNFAHQAISGANGRGAEDVLKVIELFKTDLRGISVTQGSYAEDFDFHRLITGQPAGFDFSEGVVYWAARDKEAAWTAVNEVMKSGGQRGSTYFGSLFRGVVTLEGDEKAAAWTMGKLSEIPAESRESAIHSLVMYPLPGQTVAALMQAMPEENDRVFFAAELSLPFRAGSAMGALRSLGSEDLQTRALIQSAEKFAGYAANGSPPNKETRDFFSATMDQLHFTPASRQKVEAALPPVSK